MAEPSERTNAGSGSGLTPIRPSDQPERPPAQHSFLPSTSSSTMAPAPQQGSALVRNGTHRSVDRSMWVTTPEPGIWQLLRNNMLPQSPLPGPSSPTNRTTKYKSQTHVMRGTRVTIPTRGRTWDTVLESDPARPISVDVKVEIYGAGIRDSALRARIRVASTERIRLILVRNTLPFSQS
ncbi:hypothetical protein EXIGLDRAFT_726242 [Exidia glandulosa HHB12029]|uniref:Uncharacterized protein n=1 Tax=Exidia glandulosa HHB12029 TaxID=1314781 RepID=A0A165MF32_EXIGL|nr:hypothetical protein EXIGLDRAFT_726242 [Exidia glandulosa HHB12029]